MKCPYCGKENSNNNKYCDGCGANIELSKVKVESAAISNGSNKMSVLAIAITMIILVVIVCLLVIFLLFNGDKKDSNPECQTSENGEKICTVDDDNGNNDNNGKYIENGNNENNGKSSGNKSEKELLSNVIVEFIGDLKDSNCLLKVTNNNDENINFMGTNVVLHDSKKDVDIYEQTPIYANGLGAHKSAYVSILTGSSDLKFDSFKAEYDLQKFKTTNHIDDITFTYKDDKASEKITITYKNNSNENINSFNTIVLFYKNEEVVGLGQVGGCFKDSNGNCIEVFKKGEEVTEVVKYPIAKDYKNKVDFDRFEIIVNEAYTKD